MSGLPGAAPLALPELATRHDMVLPLARSLPAGSPLWDRLHPVARARTLRAMALTGELLRLVDAFTAAGVGLVALKGPALAQALFGDPAARDPGDLDLLVRPGDIAAADRLLRALGYSRERRWDRDFAAGDLARPLRRVFHVSYHHPGSSIVVELHWRWFHIESLLPFQGEAVWGGVPCATLIAGHAVPVPPAGAQLLYLSFHAAKHRCERLKWVYDLARLLAFATDAAIADAIALARACGCLDLFMAPLLLVEDLGMAPLPPRLGATTVHPRARRLAIQLRRQLCRPPPRSEIGTWRQHPRWWLGYAQMAASRGYRPPDAAADVG